MILKSVLTAYEEKKQRNWEMLYFAVDLHGTVIERYTGNEIKVYPFAKEVLQKLSKIPDITLILFTSSYEKDLAPFFAWCLQNDIVFKHLNANPECKSNKTGDFSKKFYFNVLFDDRAGFEPETDWSILNSFFDSLVNSKHNL
jgi:hypothetical protein